MKTKNLLFLFLAGVVAMAMAMVACGESGRTSDVTVVSSRECGDVPERLSGLELFYSDSLNAFARSRPYPAPEVEYAPAPRGYKPVYISSYARHGSRKSTTMKNADIPISVLACADSLGCLTPLGRDVLEKLAFLKNDMYNSLGDLTSKGVLEHKGIAERMCRNYPNVFSRKGTPVRLYSTPVARTMLSMFACNEGLLKHNPNINSTRQSSAALAFLKGEYDRPKTILTRATHDFIEVYFDPQPVLNRLFTEGTPAPEDTAAFIENLYNCGSFVRGLDLEADTDYIWDVFTMEELFTLQQALNYYSYVFWSNSPQFGGLSLPAIKPLLKDFMDRADTALEQDVPGADLRFGHDFYLMQLLALIGVNGYVRQEEDPLKVVDTFQDFIAAPMAGNIQMVFYRNRTGDVLVKFLHNEIESWIPIDTDLYPYYHWNDVRNYFNSLIG